MTNIKNALLGTAAALALSLGAPALAQDDTAGQKQAEMQKTDAAAEDTAADTGGGEDAMDTAASDTDADEAMTETAEGGMDEDGMDEDGAMSDTAEAGTDEDGAMQQQAAGEEPDEATTTEQAATDPAAADALIVTVGEAEIRESDVMTALSALPPQARQQPPRVLVPAVVNQLIMRELVLDAAMEAGLEEDPEVVAIAGGGGQDALEQALVRVWFERELAGRITDEDIEAAYEDLKAANPDLDQSLAEVRPQIQNQLQRQAAAAVGTELREDAEIVFYDETGSPVEDTQQ